MKHLYNKKGLYWGSVIVGFIAIFFFVFSLSGQSKTKIHPYQAQHNRTQKLITVKTLAVEIKNHFEVEESYAGRVFARRQSKLGFERSGRIVSIDIEEGVRVKKGTELAQLDVQLLKTRRDELIAQLERIQAQVDEAEALLKRVNTTVKRLGGLVKKGNVSKELFDKSFFEEQALSSRLIAAKAAIKETSAALRGVDIKLQKSTLKAPYRGTIVTKYISEGTVVETGQSVFELVEDEILDIRVGVPAHAIKIFQIDKPYILEINGMDYQATLTAMLPIINTDTLTVTAILRIENANNTIRIGQLVRLKILRQLASKGFWLPISALTESRRGLWGVNVLKPAAQGEQIFRVYRQEVQMLHSASRQAYVRGMLHSGDKVVEGGNHKIVPGQLVYAHQDD